MFDSMFACVSTCTCDCVLACILGCLVQQSVPTTAVGYAPLLCIFGQRSGWLPHDPLAISCRRFIIVLPCGSVFSLVLLPVKSRPHPHAGRLIIYYYIIYYYYYSQSRAGLALTQVDLLANVVMAYIVMAYLWSI